MKLAFFTDLQLDNRPPRDRKAENGISTRFQENEATIAAAMDQAIALGAEGLLFGGDITEEKNPESASAVAAARLFSKWNRKWGVPGNHDGSVFEVSSSSIEPLAVSAGIGFTLYQKIAFDHELRCLFIPYMHRWTHEQIREAVVEATKDAGPGKIFVVMHYGHDGATVGAANTVLAGDYLPMSIFDGLDVDHVLCGHIHQAQEHVIGGIKIHVAGSCLICNISERLDRKTFGTIDTVTRVYESHEIEQPRRWVKIDWSTFTPTAETPAWQPGDIVAITGEHPRDVYPKQIIEEAIKAGTLPEPFSITYESKPQREERVARAAPINAEDGLREGLRKFVQQEFTRDSDEPGQVAPATALAMDAISESVGASYCTEIWPTGFSIRGFTTILQMDHHFTPGEPLLVLGDNGIGKSNFMAALYWAQTGELPNGMGLLEAVNRESDKCIVEVEYAGRSPEREEQRFSVARAVKISKDGIAKHDLNVCRMDTVTGIWDATTMNDGGIKERQVRLNNLLGGSPAVQRIANFSIQDDSDPFIKAHPRVRKVVIGEVTGQDPIKRAHKALDDARRQAARDLEDSKQRQAGVLAVANNADTMLLWESQDLRRAEEKQAATVTAVPVADAAVKQAAENEALAASAVGDSEHELQAVPATEPAVASAQASLSAAEQAFEGLKAQRRRDYNAKDTEAKDLEAELAGLEVPTSGAVEVLRVAAADALTGLESARSTATGASATFASAEATTTAAQSALRAAQSRLAGLPAPTVPPDLEPLQVAVRDAEVTEVETAGMVTTTQEALAAAREAAAGYAATLTTLRADLSTFDGQDVGNCARCGQAIDSTHIETETARLRQEIKATEGLHMALGLTALEAAWSTAKAARQEATGTLNEAREKLGSAERDHLTQTEAAVRLREAQAAAEEADRQLATASSALEAAAAAKGSATATHTATQTAWSEAERAYRDAEAIASTAAAKQERLRAAKARMAELVAAGMTDKAAYEAKRVELDAALLLATTTHEQAEAKRFELRGILTTRRTALVVAQQATTSARLALAKAESDLQAAATLVSSITHRIASLKTQVAMVEQAKIEIAMLTQQAQITSIAVAITEQFRLALIDQSIPFLEDRTNYWLDLLGAGSITARFSTRDGEKDTLDILIEDGKPGRALDIACYSGGQKRRVEMALKRALNELKRQSVGVTLGFHGYDEPTDGLDDKGKRAFIDMVFADSCPVQIITSHDDSIIAAFDNSIRLVRGVRDETVMEGN